MRGFDFFLVLYSFFIQNALLLLFHLSSSLYAKKAIQRTDKRTALSIPLA